MESFQLKYIKSHNLWTISYANLEYDDHSNWDTTIFYPYEVSYANLECNDHSMLKKHQFLLYDKGILQ